LKRALTFLLFCAWIARELKRIPGASRVGGAAYILSGKAFSPRKEHNTGDFAESIFAKKCKAKQPPGRVAVVEAGAEAPAIV
jgi:hypothetical protein